MHKIESSPWLSPVKHYHPPGTAPGTLVEHHPDCENKSRTTLIQYSPDYFEEITITSAEQCWDDERPDCIRWINIEGNCSPVTLSALGEHYGLHPLSMEDVLNSGQHPKMERYDDYYFLVMPLLSQEKELTAQQVSIFWSNNYIISMETSEKGAFEILRNRLRNPKAKMREMGSDYLAYCIVDTLVDRFFPCMETLREELGHLEESIFSRYDKKIIEKVHNIKMKLLILDKLVWASQELIDSIQNEEVELNSPNIELYLRDCRDHTVQVSHTIDAYREISNGLIDSHISLVSSQQNEVIKVLTMIATIFIPLTFIVGVYGMNFNPEAGPLSMPELNWAYGYVFSWIFMIALSLAMIYYFKRRKWF